jgi:hypothetical protein
MIRYIVSECQFSNSLSFPWLFVCVCVCFIEWKFTQLLIITWSLWIPSYPENLGKSESYNHLLHRTLTFLCELVIVCSSSIHDFCLHRWFLKLFLMTTSVYFVYHLLHLCTRHFTIKTIYRFHKLVFDWGGNSLECFNWATHNYELWQPDSVRYLTR